MSSKVSGKDNKVHLNGVGSNPKFGHLEGRKVVKCSEIVKSVIFTTSFVILVLSLMAFVSCFVATHMSHSVVPKIIMMIDGPILFISGFVVMSAHAW